MEDDLLDHEPLLVALLDAALVLADHHGPHRSVRVFEILAAFYQSNNVTDTRRFNNSSRLDIQQRLQSLTAVDNRSRKPSAVVAVIEPAGHVASHDVT